MEEIIKMITLITLENMFKRGKFSGCATTIAINLDGIIPTPQGFILSVRVIQAISVFRLIMTIGSFQELLVVRLTVGGGTQGSLTSQHT